MEPRPGLGAPPGAHVGGSLAGGGPASGSRPGQAPLRAEHGEGRRPPIGASQDDSGSTRRDAPDAAQQGEAVEQHAGLPPGAGNAPAPRHRQGYSGTDRREPPLPVAERQGPWLFRPRVKPLLHRGWHTPNEGGLRATPGTPADVADGRRSGSELKTTTASARVVTIVFSFCYVVCPVCFWVGYHQFR